MADFKPGDRVRHKEADGALGFVVAYAFDNHYTVMFDDAQSRRAEAVHRTDLVLVSRPVYPERGEVAVLMSSSNFPPILPTQYTQWSETNPLRCVAVIDGVSYSVISAKWTENAHGATDTLEVTLPISSNPDFTVLLFRDSSAASTAAELAAANAIVSIELWAGFPQNPSVNVTAVDQLTLFFVGEVDRYSGQFDTDVVTFTCRSVGAAMVDETMFATRFSIRKVRL